MNAPVGFGLFRDERTRQNIDAMEPTQNISYGFNGFCVRLKLNR
jgi:hypothetical protein